MLRSFFSLSVGSVSTTVLASARGRRRTVSAASRRLRNHGGHSIKHEAQVAKSDSGLTLHATGMARSDRKPSGHCKAADLLDGPSSEVACRLSRPIGRKSAQIPPSHARDRFGLLKTPPAAMRYRESASFGAAKPTNSDVFTCGRQASCRCQSLDMWLVQARIAILPDPSCSSRQAQCRPCITGSNTPSNRN